ncbi:MAG TPA: class I SAM-dependent methyltransferase [Candidatus Binataceae bacterium]|nr:class I SAM-dependent methyltransferase [Candidatus Binataceae bacterium]
MVSAGLRLRTTLTEREVAEHCNHNADSWSQRVRAGMDLYREFYNNPAFLAFIGDLRGRVVLDVGCGEGYNTRVLARQGASMTGADLSARMIDLARREEQREPLGIRYEVASFTDLSLFADASFDVAVSFMALMDGPDFPGAARELRRLLRPGGELWFSILHPCFMTKGFTWLHDQEGREIGLRVGRYFDDAPWVEHWNFSMAPDAGEAEPFSVPRFDRTLSDYVNGLIEAGFFLHRIHEPRPTPEACAAHPWLVKWHDHAPLFLYFGAQRR